MSLYWKEQNMTCRLWAVLPCVFLGTFTRTACLECDSFHIASLLLYLYQGQNKMRKRAENLLVVFFWSHLQTLNTFKWCSSDYFMDFLSSIAQKFHTVSLACGVWVNQGHWGLHRIAGTGRRSDNYDVILHCLPVPRW